MCVQVKELHDVRDWVCGGTGIRVRLRSAFFTDWEFESPHTHNDLQNSLNDPYHKTSLRVIVVLYDCIRKRTLHCATLSRW
jgi:hypothetical protein